MRNRENLEIIKEILLNAQKKEREITSDDLVYRGSDKSFERNKIEVRKRIRNTGIVDLMEMVRDTGTVTSFDFLEAEIKLDSNTPKATLSFNMTGSKYGRAWNEISAEIDEKGNLIINGAESVVVDDNSNLAKIFGEALADPKRVYKHVHLEARERILRG